MVDMHMRGHQRLNPRQIKPSLQRIRPTPPVRRRLRPLKQAAVNQQTAGVIDKQLMARAGHAMKGAVVSNIYNHVIDLFVKRILARTGSATNTKWQIPRRHQCQDLHAAPTEHD